MGGQQAVQGVLFSQGGWLPPVRWRNGRRPLPRRQFILARVDSAAGDPVHLADDVLGDARVIGQPACQQDLVHLSGQGHCQGRNLLCNLIGHGIKYQGDLGLCVGALRQGPDIVAAEVGHQPALVIQILPQGLAVPFIGLQQGEDVPCGSAPPPARGRRGLPRPPRCSHPPRAGSGRR